MIKPIIGVLVAMGTGLALFLSGKAAKAEGGGSKPGAVSKAHPETKSKNDPRSIEQRVADALATEQPDIMVRVADALDAEGFHDAAVSLRAEAERQRLGSQLPADPKPPASTSAGQPTSTSTRPTTTSTRPTTPQTRPRPEQRPPVTRPPTTPPAGSQQPTETVPEQVITALPEDPRRVAAQNLTQHLQALGGLAGRGHESKEIVRDYQVAEGLANPDGLYGSGTSMSILERHGIIPVAPYWWNKSTWKQQKAVYVDRVRKIASGDPQRKAQYETLIKDTIRS